MQPTTDKVTLEGKEAKSPGKEQLEAKFAALKAKVKKEKDNPEFHFALAESHNFGVGTPKDPKAAVKSYKKAAEKGHQEAQFRLGALSAHHGDKKAAVDHYRKAAEQGHARAQFNLALCLEQGNGVEKDKREAIEWYIKAIQNHYPISKLQELNFAREIVRSYRLVGAIFALGQCYEFGYGVTKNIKQAKECYYDAAQKGFKHAKFYLAELLLKSESAEDLEEGFTWFLELAEQNDAEAQYQVALCYLAGKGTAKSIMNGREWLEKATEKGCAKAKTALINCYQEGVAVASGHKMRALENLYRTEAAKGTAQLEFELAEFLRNEKASEFIKESRVAAKEAVKQAKLLEAEKVFQEALIWYQKAAERGLVAAQLSLGFCFDNAIGTTKSSKKAFIWYMKAAKAGNAAAQFAVGTFLERGRPRVPENFPAALTWYRKAAKQGHLQARNKLAMLQEVATPTPAPIEASKTSAKAAIPVPHI